MPEVLQNVTFDVSSGRLEQIAGGDADICTKDGRKTRVFLAVKNIQMSSVAGDPRRPAVKLYVEYKVTELVTNNTCLRWSAWHSEEVPYHIVRTAVSLSPVVSPYERTWEVSGRQHGDMAIPAIAGTVVASGTYRIDGDGDDHTNARVQMQLAVPFLCRI